MPRRIILHAGFHKTGTTTIQQTLRHNRTLLKPRVALRLRWHLRDVIHATRGYSTWRDPLSLLKVQHRFDKLLQDMPRMPRRSLILSSEELSGHLPGRGELADYSAAPDLLAAMWEVAAERFPTAEIMVYLSTRTPEHWLPSAWAEQVKSSGMTLDYSEFAARYRGAADLDAVVAEARRRLPGSVHHAALEECRGLPLGPATPLLRLCRLPDGIASALKPLPPRNVRPDPEMLQDLLRANREFTDPQARRAAKSAILAKAPAR